MTTYLTIRDICELTGFSRPFVTREMRRGRLKFGKVGRLVRVSNLSFTRWMEGRPVNANRASEEVAADTSLPAARLLARLDEAASTLSGISSRMEERSGVLEGIGVNLSALVDEVRASRR